MNHTTHSDIRSIGIGLIGAGYMGKAHAVALHAVGAAFNTRLRPKLVMIATSNASSAECAARQLGFQRHSGDWRDVVSNPEVEALVIASPQNTHRDIALAAFALGKPVFCEKPLATSLDEALEMVAAARQSGAVNMLGFNYVRTPATQFARKLIADGAIGHLIYIRTEHAEDFLADSAIGPSFRTRNHATGNLGDLAPHPVNLALALGGDINSVIGEYQTIYPERGGEIVRNDDQAHWLCRYSNGAMGYVMSTRVAHGRKMGYTYEVQGTLGTIRFDQEDQNTIWLYKAGDAAAQSGFKKILTNTAHPDYAAFNLGAGHGTGYQDQIIIEQRDFLAAIERNESIYPSFEDGLQVQRIIDAVYRSHASRHWEKVADNEKEYPEN